MKTERTPKMDVALLGFDLDIIDLILTSPDHQLVGYIDKSDTLGMNLNGIKFIGTDRDRASIFNNNPGLKLVLGMAPPNARKKVVELYGLEHIISVHSPICHVSQLADIGSGSIIQHGSIIMPCAKIGKACQLNVNTSIHHESVLGDYSTMAPGATILGRVTVGKQVFIGAGAIVKEGCRIADGATIGAGALVINDIPENATVVGVPAQRYL